MNYYSEFIKVFKKARADFPEDRAVEIAKFITKQKAIDEREKARQKPKKGKGYREAFKKASEEEKKERKEKEEFEPATDKQISYAKDLGIDANFDKISKQRLSELIGQKLKEKGD